MSTRDPKDCLAFALDYPNIDEARSGACEIAPHVGVLKVGLELFIKEGPSAVRMAADLGCNVFLDLKLHDIPKTVERAVATAASLGVAFLTIHTSGGPKMMEAAAQRAEQEGAGLCVLGVSVLTSLSDEDLTATGVLHTPSEQAKRLAVLAKECGLGGLVCSSAEVQKIRELVGSKLVLVTPGIRPSGTDHGDQKRVGTPAEAISAGSDLLVVGRPIRDAQSPSDAARNIVDDISEALS